MPKFIDLTGKKFNKLTPINCVGKDKHGNYLWLCKCDCGNEKIIPGNKIRNGNNKACGCLSKEGLKLGSLANITHGQTHAPIYNIWNGMNQRCGNPNNTSYKNYGGRGIKVCKRWLKFENFYKDVGDPPKGKSLDRINNNEGYFPNNWRWATRKQQNNNKRNSSRRPIMIRRYERKLRKALSGLKLLEKNKIGYSKYLPYNNKQLYDHLENIKGLQNNSCPTCNKSYNEIKYDIDHIIPISTAKTKEELLKLFNLENLSLLCWRCNRHIKRSKMIMGEEK